MFEDRRKGDNRVCRKIKDDHQHQKHLRDPPCGKTATDGTAPLSCNKPTIREKSAEEPGNLLLASFHHHHGLIV